MVWLVNAGVFDNHREDVDAAVFYNLQGGGRPMQRRQATSTRWQLSKSREQVNDRRGLAGV